MICTKAIENKGLIHGLFYEEYKLPWS